MKRRYPPRLFLFNLVLNFLVRYFYLFVPGVLLCLAGVRFEYCMALGVACLGADLAVSLIDQLKNRKRVLANGEHEAYLTMMDAALSAGGAEGFRREVENRMTCRTPAPGETQNELENPYE